MSRLIIISNRLPVTIDKKDGELFYHPSAGGLATGLMSLRDGWERIWVGWPGKAIHTEEEQEEVTASLAELGLVPVFLDKKDIALYYEGFSNKIIWPLFHYFSQYATYRDAYWERYQHVNQKFAKVVASLVQPGDTVWVHDYQLLLLPQLVREQFPQVSIGFFLHIPFPSYEIFRTLPYRKQILAGLLGADQIGFHTFGYMRHFLSAVYRISGVEHHFGKLTFRNRIINVDVFPMGIDYQKYAFPENYTTHPVAPEKFIQEGVRLILSIDRLDYTKGIPERIRAYSRFLEQNPQYHGKVTLAMIVVPSRSNVDQYQELKREVDTLVGQLYGQYSTFDWDPIQYFYRSFPFADLTALYQAADVALITPLRDGMNLVAKEFIAAKEKTKRGVLILSEMAGASDQLTEALSVNPNDEQDIIRALEKALSMKPEEQARRLELMQDSMKTHTVQHWAETFIDELTSMKEFSDSQAQSLEIGSGQRQEILQEYQEAHNRLVILDYDGTLMGFATDPQAVQPDEKLLKLLQKLKDDPKNKLVVISGRDRETLDNWLSPLGIDMAAEHGVWMKRDGVWSASRNLFKAWKKDMLPILENLVDRTPGTFIEEKDYSLAWHYRKIDKALGEKRIREYRDVLQYLTSGLDLQVLEGNKVVEIKNAGVNKGKATASWLHKSNWDFIIAIGDDQTDEDIFKALPESAHSIKVGIDQTVARYNLLSVDDVRGLLRELAEK